MASAEYQRNYRKTPKGWAIVAWSNILGRLKHDADYAEVELRMTRWEFVRWCEKAIAVWWKGNPGKRPSVDRIDNDGPYSLDNIRILELGENSRRRPFNRNSKAPEGVAWCSGHGDYLDITLFSPAPSRPPLYVNNRCRECKRSAYRRKVGENLHRHGEQDAHSSKGS